MTAPPGRAPHQKPTGGHVSENAVELAAAAIRRAGHVPTPRTIRIVLRADRDARRNAEPTTEPTSEEDFDWWDRLVRALPHELCRARKVSVTENRVGRGSWRTVSA